VTKNIK